jgi:alkaline phosphatase
MKTKFVFGIIFLSFTRFVSAQEIFAHNDYEKPKPFYRAFELRAAYIEADIFLEDGKLLVAHTKRETDRSKTLESMYLKPLSQRLNEIYGLHLMIDLKTEGTATLNALVNVLEGFPELIKNDKLFIVISGSYPPPSDWNNYPSYIWFDGRPKIDYTKGQVDRLKLVSTSYPGNDPKKIEEVIDFAHTLGKPVRFWAAPDNEEGWRRLVKSGVDILNTDNIEALSQLIPVLRSESRRSR